jgi:hypothetical protein
MAYLVMHAETMCEQQDLLEVSHAFLQEYTQACAALCPQTIFWCGDAVWNFQGEPPSVGREGVVERALPSRNAAHSVGGQSLSEWLVALLLDFTPGRFARELTVQYRRQGDSALRLARSPCVQRTE